MGINISMRLYEFDKTVHILPGLKFYWKFNDDPVNQNIFTSFRYLQPKTLKSQEILYIKDKDKIVGAAGLQKSPDEKDVYWLTFVEIDRNYRNQGIGAFLLDKIFQFAQAHQANIRNSSYSIEGETYLKKVIDRMKRKYPNVGFKEAGDTSLFEINI